MRKISKYSPVLFTLALGATVLGAISFSKLQDPEVKVMSQPKMLSMLQMEDYRPPEQIKSPSLAFKKAKRNSSGVLAIYRTEDEHGDWYDKVLLNPGIGSYLNVIAFLRLDKSKADSKAFMERYDLGEKSTILLLDYMGNEILRLEGSRDLSDLAYHLQQIMVTRTVNEV